MPCSLVRQPLIGLSCALPISRWCLPFLRTPPAAARRPAEGGSSERRHRVHGGAIQLIRLTDCEQERFHKSTMAKTIEKTPIEHERALTHRAELCEQTLARMVEDSNVTTRGIKASAAVRSEGLVRFQCAIAGIGVQLGFEFTKEPIPLHQDHICTSPRLCHTPE